jgi:hypothetical protein
LKHRARGRAELRPSAIGSPCASAPRKIAASSWTFCRAAGVYTAGRRASATGEQIVAANVDVVFIVMGLDRDYNLRRLETLPRDGARKQRVAGNRPDQAGSLFGSRRTLNE